MRITIPAAENRNRYDRRDPVLGREPRGDQHPEHAGVNRISHIGVRTYGDQLVTFDKPSPQCPLLAECANGRLKQPPRPGREKHGKYREQDSWDSRERRDRRQKGPPRRLKPNQKIGAHLQNDTQRRLLVALRLRRFRRALAKQENPREKEPAKHHPHQSRERDWSWTRHAFLTSTLSLIEQPCSAWPLRMNLLKS